MKNFINLRLQAYNHNKQLNILKHNARKIKSLSEGAFVEYVGETKHKTNYVILDNNDMFDLNDKSIREILYTSNKNIYEKDRKLHNEKMYARKQRNLINEQATWLEGIFTFSEAIHKDLGNKYNLEELSKVANDCAKHLAKEMGSELRYLVVHQDEKTLHFHLAFKNFDDNGYSIFHKIKNKETLSRFQDIAFEHFKALGMQRGISKEITGKNYQTIQNYYITQEMKLRQKIDILNLDFEGLTKEFDSLNNQIKKLNDTKKELVLYLSENTNTKEVLLKDIEGLKTLKNTIKTDLDLTKEEKQKEYEKIEVDLKLKRGELNLVYSDISKAKENIKSIDIETKSKQQELENVSKQFELKSLEVDNFNNINKSLDKEVEKIVDDLIENPVRLLGKDAILDIDALKGKTKEQLRKALKVDIKTKEVDILKQENQALKGDLKQKEDQNNILLDKLNEERNKNKVLEQNKGQIIAQNQKALQTMDKQQKAFQKQIRTNTRLRKQRQRLMQKIIKDNNLTKTIQLKSYLKTIKTKDIKKDIKEAEDNTRDR